MKTMQVLGILAVMAANMGSPPQDHGVPKTFWFWKWQHGPTRGIQWRLQEVAMPTFDFRSK